MHAPAIRNPRNPQTAANSYETLEITTGISPLSAKKSRNPTSINHVPQSPQQQKYPTGDNNSDQQKKKK